MIRCLVGVVSFALPFLIPAQSLDTSYPVFEQDKLPVSFFKSNRDEVKRQIGLSGAALFFTNPERNRNNDSDFRFRGDSNFLYLTGFEEPDAALLLVPGGVEVDGRRVKELLFVNEPDLKSQTWLGYRMGPQGVQSILGVEYAVPNRRFPEIIQQVSKLPGIHFSKPSVPPDPSGPVAKWLKSYRDLSPAPDESGPNLPAMLNKMRVKKTPEELELMRKAADVSATGHIEAMRTAKPGIREYELQAVVEYVFARMGCEFPAYSSIVGSGPNSTILHYEANRRMIESGDLICMDVAGEFHGYAADVTRTYPANGRFSPEQKAIYELVLAAQTAGIDACKVGASFRASHEAASKVLENGLKKLGIIKESSELRQYFMHGTSHYVGLDVHDAHGDNTLRDSYVLTVEPGIYIKAGSPCDKKWWNIGVRIEDDILVTEKGPVTLSAAAPRTVPDIERTMRERGFGLVPIKGR